MLYKIPNYLIKNIVTKIGEFLLSLQEVSYGQGLLLRGFPIISKAPNSSIKMGDRVVLCSWSSLTALGVNHPVVLRTLSENAVILIGNDVGISGASICSAKRIEIGDQTMLGANIIIADTDFHSMSPNNRRYNKDESMILSSEVIIGENVFIGANSIILKGVNIGSNSVIGAGSIVTNNIPPNAIAAGNPCRVLRLFDKEVK